MELKGGCYCQSVKYEINGDVKFAQCHCRECQYISGGHPNAILLTQESNVTFTIKNFLKEFTRQDIEKPVTRLFCEKCGTSIGVNKNPFRPNIMIIKVGTLDDPSIYKPQAAQFIAEAQDFHHIPKNIPTFPGRAFQS